MQQSIKLQQWLEKELIELSKKLMIKRLKKFDPTLPKLLNTINAIKKFKETDDFEIFYRTREREISMLEFLKHENIMDLKEMLKPLDIILLV